MIISYIHTHLSSVLVVINSFFPTRMLYEALLLNLLILAAIEFATLNISRRPCRSRMRTSPTHKIDVYCFSFSSSSSSSSS